MRMMLLKILASVCALCLLVAAQPAGARQGGGTTYVYDDSGRLRAVLSPTGEAAVYDYDPAGNVTAVRRLTPNDLEILGFTPPRGPVGTPVTIYGTGFDQGVTSVSFNGATAAVVRSGLASVVALVPPDATTGPITVVTPRGPVTSARPFVVRGVLLSPQFVTLSALDTLQFGLSVSGTPTGAVVWSVNGEEGGSTTVGIVSEGGLYTAPNVVGGSPVTYSVRATSVDDPSLFGEAKVVVLPSGAGYQFRSGDVSVRYGTPVNRPPTYVAGAVSVRYGTPANTPPAYIGGAVSVRYGTPANAPPTYVSGAASVRYGAPSDIEPAYVSGSVSAGRGPVLSSLSPASTARGSTFTLTVGGVGLGGASGVRFFNLSNGTPATNITATNINVNGQGTTLTATVTVPSDAAAGRYLVVVTTPAGSTARNAAGPNVLQVN